MYKIQSTYVLLPYSTGLSHVTSGHITCNITTTKDIQNISLVVKTTYTCCAIDRLDKIMKLAHTVMRCAVAWVWYGVSEWGVLSALSGRWIIPFSLFFFYQTGL